MRDCPSRRGSFLIMGLLVSLVISLLLASAIITVNSLSRNSQFTLSLTDALTRADAVTEGAQKDLLARLASFQPAPAGGAITLGGAGHPYTVRPVGPVEVRAEPDGTLLATQRFEISAAVRVDTAQGSVARVIEAALMPIFQFMIFYDGDLEIHPGANMTLEGRVHSNRSIYLGSGSSSALTINSDSFRAAREMLRERKDTGSGAQGTVQIKVLGESQYESMQPGQDSSHSDWLRISEEWKGSVRSGAHGVKETAVPEVRSFKAVDPVTGDKGFYHAQAGLVIRDGEAYDPDGFPVALPPGTLTEKTMYDARESGTVKVTEVNIALLNGSGRFPANGLLYAYRSDASAAQPNGIRLAGGARLASPLTVVSEDPVYIKGDFNTQDQKGAAVIADSVNLLSNAWNDSKARGVLPQAQGTRYNLAMITGHVPTPDGGGTYSGGFENLPRFHENWTNVQATIQGSFISLYESEVGRAPWRYGGDVYTAPLRNWSFDPRFRDPANLPPFTPLAVWVRRAIWDDRLPSPLRS